MARGSGPPPSPPGSRSRKSNADRAQAQLKVVHAEPVPQPELPTMQIERDGQLVEFVWPARTIEWWAMWKRTPLSAEFTDTDWSELLDTAVIHAKFWRGATNLAAELRLRTALYGATPADRARLRITFAQADGAEVDTKAKTDKATARSRYGSAKPTAVPDPTPEAEPGDAADAG